MGKKGNRIRKRHRKMMQKRLDNETKIVASQEWSNVRMMDLSILKTDDNADEGESRG